MLLLWLKLLLASGLARVVGGLQLGRGGAAVRHGQLTQVGRVGGEDCGALAAVQTSFS